MLRPNRMKKRSKLVIACMVALILGVLAPGMGVSAPPPVPPKAPALSVPPAPAAAESPFIFKFDPAGKPDPFKPFVDVEMALKKKKAEELSRLQKQQKTKEQKQVLSIFPLQRLALNQFKLVGIAGNAYNRTAMVQDPASKFYPLVIGTLIGLNGAKVVEIRESSVILEEITQVASAKSKKKRTEKKRIEMKLHQEGEEGKP